MFKAGYRGSRTMLWIYSKLTMKITDEWYDVNNKPLLVTLGKFSTNF